MPRTPPCRVRPLVEYAPLGVLPIQDSIAEGVSHPVAEIPLLYGGIAAQVHMLGEGNRARYLLGAPILGSPERGHPGLFRFPRFLPISSDFPFLVFGNAPICSDLLRFLLNKSEQIKGTPSCRPLLQVPVGIWGYC